MNAARGWDEMKLERMKQPLPHSADALALSIHMPWKRSRQDRASQLDLLLHGPAAYLEYLARIGRGCD